MKLTKEEKQQIKYLENPWYYNGKVFDDEDIGNHMGFVYRITDEQGKMYIGRKYFYSMRKVAGRTNRKRFPSNWKQYFSSSDDIKLIKKNKGHLHREILSLHETEGLVNYHEVSFQFKFDVLTAKDVNGEFLYYNDNIQGRYFRSQYLRLDERSVLSDSI